MTWTAHVSSVIPDLLITEGENSLFSEHPLKETSSKHSPPLRSPVPVKETGTRSVLPAQAAPDGRGEGPGRRHFARACCHRSFGKRVEPTGQRPRETGERPLLPGAGSPTRGPALARCFLRPRERLNRSVQAFRKHWPLTARRRSFIHTHVTF